MDSVAPSDGVAGPVHSGHRAFGIPIHVAVLLGESGNYRRVPARLLPDGADSRENERAGQFETGT